MEKTNFDMRMVEILLGTTLSESGLNLEKSMKIIRLYPAVFEGKFCKEGVHSFAWSCVNDLGNPTEEFAISEFLRPLNSADILTIAQMRVDIEHTHEEREWQRKIQKMFQFTTRLNKPYLRKEFKDLFEVDKVAQRRLLDTFGPVAITQPNNPVYERFLQSYKNEAEKELLNDRKMYNFIKKSYEETWLNMENCMTAFSDLKRIEQRGTNSQYKDDLFPVEIPGPYLDRADPFFVAKKRIANVEYLIRLSAFETLKQMVGNVRCVQGKQKGSELGEDSGLPVSDEIHKGIPSRLPMKKSGGRG